jgi:hypothetical protein
VKVHSGVSIRAHYERFPATIKGALVLRGEDRDPHQVQIRTASVADLSGSSSFPLGVSAVTLDVAPHLDLFVPFEFPVTDLAPGWYGLECEVAIDGHPAAVRPGPPFPVAWPRASVRRGTLTVGKTARLDDGSKVRIERVDCGGDTIRVSYEVATSEPVEVRLTADGRRLPVLETDFDEEAGRGRVTAYPLLKSHGRLEIEVKGASPLVVQLG